LGEADAAAVFEVDGGVDDQGKVMKDAGRS
jgi:hypothetical protein